MPAAGSRGPTCLAVPGGGGLGDRLSFMPPSWVTLDRLFEDHEERPDTNAFAHACNLVYRT